MTVTFWAEVSVSEEHAGRIRLNDSVTITLDALPGARMVGHVVQVNPAANPQSRAFAVRAVLDNRAQRIKPGMLMTVRVSSEERLADAVPELAVTGRGDARFVFLVTPEKRAKQLPVKTGLRDSGLIEVSGLPAGAKVIGDGVIKVSDGMAVRLRGDKPRPTRTASAD